ncbi:hypothetical protein CGLO_07106 [Colletotrichum gloeosporioides Cg-14]|uniref:Uncharacterized protein n=1 Tax=Colletotrichum gloeosporioides (strain Cg-14) TaxID=1237896 RepID=T0KMJ6_COLGC|nr:hypothetical protein CGLO_07106 [Colletotrichum gloeosporioides Cg-14]
MSLPTSSFLNHITSYGAYLESTIHLPPKFRFFTNDAPHFLILEIIHLTFTFLTSAFLLPLWQLSDPYPWSRRRITCSQVLVWAMFILVHCSLTVFQRGMEE